MAFLELRDERYRVVFTFGGKRYTHSVRTDDKRVADGIRGGIDRTILQIQQRLIRVPEGADVKEFIVSNGQSLTLTSDRFPNKGLRYPKQDEKPPFMTREQILLGGFVVTGGEHGWFGDLATDRNARVDPLPHVREITGADNNVGGLGRLHESMSGVSIAVQIAKEK